MLSERVVELVRADSTRGFHSLMDKLETNITTTRKLCTLYIRGMCNDIPCKLGEHVDAPDRPICSEWLHNGACRYPKCCWWKHEGVSSLEYQIATDFVLQCRWSHEVRVVDYLLDRWGKDIHSLHVSRYFGANRKDDRAVHVKLVSGGSTAARFIAEIVASPCLSRAVSRSYTVMGAVRTSEELLQQVQDALVPLALARFGESACTRAQLNGEAGEDTPKPELLLRMQSYPNALELPLIDQLHISGLPTLPGVRVEGSKSAWHARVCVVHVAGWRYWGIETQESPSVSSAAAAAVVNGVTPILSPVPIICRAQYKLLEVVERMPAIGAALCGRAQGAAGHVWASSAGSIANAAESAEAGAEGRQKRIAMDIGAAPGGWCMVLGTTCGYDTVLAVDPAEVSTDPPLPSCVQHWKMSSSQALEKLKGSGVKLHGLTCDMNTPTGTTVAILEECGPALSPGCPVVLTLKNFNGRRQAWLDDLQKAVETARRLCTDVQVAHLFANGTDEVTLCGLWAGAE